MTVELAIAPGFHLYGDPIPSGYVPLSLDVAPIEGLALRPMRWTSPHPFNVAGLNEEFWAYEGTIRGTLPFAFTAAPGAGDHVIRATIKYQACSAASCLPSATVQVAMAVSEVALVGRALPARGSGA